MSPKAKAIIYLLTASLIWGCSYPIGRAALDVLTPLSYSGLRFLFGAFSLLPLALRRRRHPAPTAYGGNDSPHLWLWSGLLSGLCLSLGSILQLSGMAHSTAGKVGFITTLYVSMVPVLAFVIGYIPRLLILIGLGIGLIGLSLLTGGTGGLGPSEGLVLVADVFWAVQVLITGRFAARVNTWLFSLAQAATCGVITLSLAIVFGQMPSLSLFIHTLPFTLWGIMSAGVAYVCQTAAQRSISSTSAALVFPLQSVIGAAAGMLFLGEHMSQKMVVGAAIIVLGCIVAQFARESTKIEPNHRHWKKFLAARISLGAVVGLGAAGILIWAYMNY